MSNTYAIASAKGGVGKTTTVANLGAALAAAGEDVAVVDADIGMANLADTLGIDPDGATLHDVLAGTAALEDALYEGADGLTVLPGSAELDDYRTADLDGLADVLADLAADHEYVLVDTGAGLSHDAVLPLEVVDEVLLVSTPQPQALGDTDKTRGLVERLGGSVAGLVLTRAGTEASADPVAVDVVGRIPDDPAIDEAVIAGEPVVSFAPDSPAADAYRTLVAAVFGVDVPAGTEAESGEADSVEAESAEAESAEVEDADAEDADPEDAANETETAESGASDAEPSADAAAADSDNGEDGTSDDSADEDDQPASVGPHRTEDVPVSEAEPGPESPDGIDSTIGEDAPEEGGTESAAASNSESKGFFSRLLGR